ncbi:hexokinase-1-like [Aristolochia californica]|uniref:hexokinase-1-like n=1 Tax=Aristolochia californica TaxID=171875 RepID=UPI0035E215D6
MALVALLVHQELKRTRQWRRANRFVKKFTKQGATPVKKLWQLADAMAFHMQIGLASNDSSGLQMIVTDIDSLPTGDEEGLFYGLDLGRTDLRLSRVKMGGKDSRVINQEVKAVPIPASLMVGSLKEGKDMVEEINKALQNKGVHLHVSELVNDTVATLASGRYFGFNAVAAVILGMGTNASYVEDALSIPKCEGPLPLSGEMVINIEWGNFHSGDLPITEFDISLDVESLNPGEQIFDKLISGMCLGEIVRKALLRLSEETSLPGDSVPPKLRIPFALRTSDMAAMHQDTSEGLEVVAEKLKESPQLRELAVKICDIVTNRAARLTAAAIVGILKKMDKMKVQQQMLVAVDGELYEHYRLYRDYLHGTVNEMLGNQLRSQVMIKHLDDGSGIGAALLAASYSHYVKDS